MGLIKDARDVLNRVSFTSVEAIETGDIENGMISTNVRIVPYLGSEEGSIVLADFLASISKGMAQTDEDMKPFSEVSFGWFVTGERNENIRVGIVGDEAGEVGAVATRGLMGYLERVGSYYLEIEFKKQDRGGRCVREFGDEAMAETASVMLGMFLEYNGFKKSDVELRGSRVVIDEGILDSLQQQELHENLGRESSR